MGKLYLIVYNVRSAHNVGSLLRTADGLGIDKVYLAGYTPYPKTPNDSRLPHEADSVHRRIVKTALGAESSVQWEHREDLSKLIFELKSTGVRIVALEQTADSKMLNEYKPTADIAIIVGSEREGVEPEILKLCDEIIEIPMSGKKESFNVAVAGAIALYHLKYLA